eukprot:gene10220-biopygen5849
MFTQRCSNPYRENVHPKVQQSLPGKCSPKGAATVTVTVTPCGAVWRRVVPCGAVWRYMAPCGAVWGRAVPCDAVWRRVQQSVPCVTGHAVWRRVQQGVPCGIPCAIFPWKK